jgi:hypothetical protein
MAMIFSKENPFACAISGPSSVEIQRAGSKLSRQTVERLGKQIGSWTLRDCLPARAQSVEQEPETLEVVLAFFTKWILHSNLLLTMGELEFSTRKKRVAALLRAIFTAT